MHFKKLVINLKSRPDRKSEMERQLSMVGWEADFIEAVQPTARDEFPSIGARGCFESHLSALKAGIGSHVILIEDDLNFASDFRKEWPAAVACLPHDWSLFYPANETVSGLVDSQRGLVGSHMLVFRDSIVERMIAELEIIRSRPSGHPQGGPMHVDGAYSTIRAQNPDMKTYSNHKPLGYQRASRTDIGDPHWVDQHFPSVAKIARLLKSVLRTGL